MRLWDLTEEEYFAITDKWSPVLRDMSSIEMMVLAVGIAHYLLMPVFMDREGVQDIVGGEVSEEEFREFHHFCWKNDDDAAANLVQECWDAWRDSLADDELEFQREKDERGEEEEAVDC